MVTMLRASPRVQWTFFTTPWCTQLDGHRTIGRYKLTPHQPGPSASWRPPAKARDVDGAHAQSIPASAMDLSHNATVSPIGWQSKAWAIQTHPTPTGCVREVGAHTCKPETSMVTMPRVARRVRRTRARTPWCPQLGAHGAFGGYNFSPPQPGASASWLPPAKDRDVDGDHALGISAIAMDLFSQRHGVPNLVAIEQLGDTSSPHPNRVRPRVGEHPGNPEMSMVTMPRAIPRVQWTFFTTPRCLQFGGSRTIGRYKLTPPKPGASASWRPPTKDRDVDGDHAQGIPASAMDLFHNAMVSPIRRPLNNWVIQTHSAPTGCVRNLAPTCESQRRRW